MRGLSGDELLRLPVRLNGIELGRPIDIVLDGAATHIAGFVVLCGDKAKRFLPFGAARVRTDSIEVGSALTLLDDPDFYRRRGAALGALRSRLVSQRGRALGALQDVVLGDHGELSHLVVDGRRIAVEQGLAVGGAPAGRTAA